MKKHIFILFAFVLLAGVNKLSAQTVNPYFLNGNALQENCNCYTLTPDVLNQSGAVWNINKINLNNSFNYVFDVSLGCADSDGADGIVFVLQPISVSIGTTGGGLGFENVSPSIGIAIDTWQNSNNNDPSDDHIAIHRDGDLNHNSVNNLAGPVSALENSGNIEDCKTHSFRIIWDAPSKKLKAQIDGVDRVETTIDLVGDVFHNDPMVFWGFTGSTGGSKNLQRFCTALNAGFTIPADLNTCFPVSIPFNDSSASFGPIVRWDWDFGDGTRSDLPVPPPHTYAAPGNYDVKLNILGSNGCLSDTFQQRIVVGSIPTAAFIIDPPVICDSLPMFFNDRSTVEFGTIDQWNWQINADGYTEQSPGPVIFKNTGGGTAGLTVTTKEGCVSSAVSQSFEVFKRPAVAYTAGDACIVDAVNFVGANLNDEVDIVKWNWKFGDGSLSSPDNSTNRLYRAAGVYPTSLIALSDKGCPSFEMKDTLEIFETKANAGKDTILATGQPYQLTGSGGDIYNWSPSSGLSDPNISNPVATLQQDATFTLTTTTSFGCATTDFVTFKVYKGPEIYVPNAFTPNNDGKNDRFRPVAVGMSEITFFRVFNRYGQLVYDSRDTFTGWDGKTNGRTQASGTYVWQVGGIDFTGKQHVKKGTVTLVR